MLVVGGTFDPPHLAHASLPDAARRELWQGRGRIVFVPASCSPLKEQSAAAAADRLAMLRLALAGMDRVCIWTHELDRPPPSYTVDTLRVLRSAVGAAPEVRLLIGADQAAAFHRWRSPREIIALAEPVVVPRDPCADAAALAAALRETGAWNGAEITAWTRRLLPVPLVGISATRVRDLLRRRPRPIDALRPLLPAGVLGYIEGNNLY